jgi:hypothetical protein
MAPRPSSQKEPSRAVDFEIAERDASAAQIQWSAAD